MNQKELMKFFNFDKTGLSANRACVLSQKQLQNYAQGNKILRVIAVVVGLILLGMTLMVPFRLIPEVKSVLNEPGFLLPLLGVMLFWVLLWGFIGFNF